MPIHNLHKLLRLLIRKYDIPLRCRRHEQVLTERARPLPQDLIGIHGNNRTEGKYEVMDVLHVEEVGGHGVRDGVLGEFLRAVAGEVHHVLGVDLDGVVV